MTGPTDNSREPCTLIIPFHGHWEHLRFCLWSVKRFTSHPFNLILVDDASDAVVARHAKQFVQDSPEIDCRLVRNEQCLGFVKSCNAALKMTRAPHAVILNSDTMVTPGWLRKMVACAQSDERIALVNPLTNWAGPFSIPMPMGYDFLQFAEAVESISRKVRPDIVMAVGFCLLFTRRAIDDLGYFDEIYGKGYGEETDYSLRALDRGLRVVATDDTFVWHRGRATFGNAERARLLGRNKETVRKRWGHLFDPAWREYKRIAPLAYVMRSFAMSPLGNFGADSLFQRFLMIRDTFGLVYALAATARYFLRHARARVREAMPGPVRDRLWSPVRRKITSTILLSADLRKPAARTESSPARPRAPKPTVGGGRPSVIYLMWQIKLGGGSHSVVQLVNRLTLQGWDAKIALTLQRDQRAIQYQTHYTQPYFYRDPSHLLKSIPQADLYVATYWPTARWAAELLQKHPDSKAAYFIQDYEADFYPEDDRRHREAVLDTYPLIDNRIVKTEWLRQKLANHGHDSTIIPAGLDTDIFYALPREKSNQPPTVVCAARPNDPRRGFEALVETLSILKTKRPEVRIVFFGADALKRGRAQVPFEYEHTGPLSPSEMAALYRQADLFIDASLWQGLGRTALEAMACGCACVLTENGGIRDFAVDGENCLLCEPTNPGQIARKAEQILRDPGLRERLVTRGLSVGEAYSLDREVEKTAAYFDSLCDQEHEDREITTDKPTVPLSPKSR